MLCCPKKHYLEPQLNSSPCTDSHIVDAPNFNATHASLLTVKEASKQGKLIRKWEKLQRCARGCDCEHRGGTKWLDWYQRMRSSNEREGSCLQLEMGARRRLAGKHIAVRNFWKRKLIIIEANREFSWRLPLLWNWKVLRTPNSNPNLSSQESWILRMGLSSVTISPPIICKLPTHLPTFEKT